MRELTGIDYLVVPTGYRALPTRFECPVCDEIRNVRDITELQFRVGFDVDGVVRLRYSVDRGEIPLIVRSNVSPAIPKSMGYGVTEYPSMFDRSGIVCPPYGSEKLGFSTSIVVTIMPPLPLLHRLRRDCEPYSTLPRRLWNVPSGSDILPPHADGIWLGRTCEMSKPDIATYCPPCTPCSAVRSTPPRRGGIGRLPARRHSRTLSRSSRGFSPVCPFRTVGCRGRSRSCKGQDGLGACPRLP